MHACILANTKQINTKVERKKSHDQVEVKLKMVLFFEFYTYTGDSVTSPQCLVILPLLVYCILLETLMHGRNTLYEARLLGCSLLLTMRDAGSRLENHCVVPL